MSDSTSMRGRLMEFDSIDDADRQSYDAALHALFNKKLGRFDRLRYLVPAVGGGLAAVLLPTLALTEPEITPLSTRLALGSMGLIGAVWFAIASHVLRRSSIHLERDCQAVVLAALLGTTLQAAYFGWRTRNSDVSAAGFWVSLVFLAIAIGLAWRQRGRKRRLDECAAILRAQSQYHS